MCTLYPAHSVHCNTIHFSSEVENIAFDPDLTCKLTGFYLSALHHFFCLAPSSLHLPHDASKWCNFLKVRLRIGKCCHLSFTFVFRLFCALLRWCTTPHPTYILSIQILLPLLVLVSPNKIKGSKKVRYVLQGELFSANLIFPFFHSSPIKGLLSLRWQPACKSRKRQIHNNGSLTILRCLHCTVLQYLQLTNKL